MMRAVSIAESDRLSRTAADDAGARVGVLQRRIDDLRARVRDAERQRDAQAARARRALQVVEAQRRELQALRQQLGRD
jgi:hypothetical protein